MCNFCIKLIKHVEIFTCFYMNTVAVSVSFNQSTYMINKNDGLVQPVLVLNNSVTTDITLQVITNDITATGEYINIIINNMFIIIILQEEVLIIILDHTMSYFLLE